MRELKELEGTMPIKDRLEHHAYFRDVFEFASQGLKYLMIAHAAGLATCVSLLKDYDSTPQFKGIGIFVWLFGIGLMTAVISYAALEVNLNSMFSWIRGRKIFVTVGVVLTVLLYAPMVTSIFLLLLGIALGIRYFGSL